MFVLHYFFLSAQPHLSLRLLKQREDLGFGYPRADPEIIYVILLNFHHQGKEKVYASK